MAALWYSPADTKVQRRDGSGGTKNMTGITMGGISKLILHSTESAGWPSYPDFAPTLTYDPWKHQWRQHMPLNKSATTLSDPSSTAVRENRDDVVQVEIVGYCDPAAVKKYGHDVTNLDDQAVADLAAFIAFLHTEWSLPLVSVPKKWLPYPSSYGSSGGQRLSGSAYDAFKGILGHQHVSGNDHGDPGPIPIDAILAAAKALVAPAPAPVTATPTPAPAPVSKTPTTPKPDPASVPVVPGGRVFTGWRATGTNPSTGRSWWAAGFHPGDDWHTGAGAGDLGKPVASPVSGKVVHVGTGGWGAAYGIHVIVEDATGDRTAICHLRKATVALGAWVFYGDKLGELGQTGNVSGPHVHVERRKGPYGYWQHTKPVYGTAAPFPGAAAFRLDRIHPAVTLLGRRLIAHGFAAKHDGNGYQAGPRFTKYDRANVRAFQIAQGWTGSDADGYPGPSTWKLLMARAK